MLAHGLYYIIFKPLTCQICWWIFVNVYLKLHLPEAFFQPKMHQIAFGYSYGPPFMDPRYAPAYRQPTVLAGRRHDTGWWRRVSRDLRRLLRWQLGRYNRPKTNRSLKHSHRQTHVLRTCLVWRGTRNGGACILHPRLPFIVPSKFISQIFRLRLWLG